jgi:hypothetical protein
MIEYAYSCSVAWRPYCSCRWQTEGSIMAEEQAQQGGRPVDGDTTPPEEQQQSGVTSEGAPVNPTTPPPDAQTANDAPAETGNDTTPPASGE